MILRGEIKTPPMSESARRETGFLLRRLQQGESLALPHSRPMPDIGRRCHELRVNDVNKTWRVIYRIDDDQSVASLKATSGIRVGGAAAPRILQLSESDPGVWSLGQVAASLRQALRSTASENAFLQSGDRAGEMPLISSARL